MSKRFAKFFCCFSSRCQRSVRSEPAVLQVQGSKYNKVGDIFSLNRAAKAQIFFDMAMDCPTLGAQKADLVHNNGVIFTHQINAPA